MNPRVLIVNAITMEADSISGILQQAGYMPCFVDNLERAESVVRTSDCMAVLLDLDSLDVSNRIVRQMTLKFPHVYFLCTSREPFHPDLQEAIGNHFYACIQKPVDPDELLFWMKCIHQKRKSDLEGAQVP